jgi:hypothetical protein
VVPGDDTEVWGRIHMNRGRVGEERGGKETDGCLLTLYNTSTLPHHLTVYPVITHIIPMIQHV